MDGLHSPRRAKSVRLWPQPWRPDAFRENPLISCFFHSRLLMNTARAVAVQARTCSQGTPKRGLDGEGMQSAFLLACERDRNTRAESFWGLVRAACGVRSEGRA
jgi:hypothetical protein